jgi:hypothetical protein
MIENKLELLDKARQEAAVDQFDHTKLNPSLTKLGPCMQMYGKISRPSWRPPTPTPETYIEAITNLGNKHESLSWVPLPVPKITFDNYEEFLEIWDQEAIPIKRVDEPDDAAEFKGFHITSNALLDFNLHDMYVNGKMTTALISEGTGYTQGRRIVGNWTKKLYKHKMFFNMISNVMKYFPIKYVSNILLVEPIKDVAPHREQSWVWKCPTEFRINLYDENTEPTWYVSNIQTGETKYINLPDDTNSFCWSNGTHVYGMDYHGKRSFQLIVNAVWTSKGIDDLVTQSLEKYGKQ